MKNAWTRFLAGRLLSDSSLSRHQQENLEALLRISDTFHADAGIRMAQKIPVSEKILVLESGHQPNFLPYPGVWKKVFLLHRIEEYLNSNGQDAIAVFGFADQNLSTAKLLYENKVPAVNKQGNRKVGFKAGDARKWNCFNTQPKPGRDEWEREISDLRNYYLHYLPGNDADSRFFLDNIDILTGVLEKCYARSASMAELNAFVFAKTCSELFDMPVHFFCYSDVQRNSLFIDEWKKILGLLPLYNTTYNSTITEKNLNLSPVAHDFFPFWYHCSCGAKVAIQAGSAPMFSVTCPGCKTNVSFVLDPGSDDLADRMRTMGLSGVARNVVFSQGLGTHLFISGSGGGLQYGQVANEISRKFAWNIPITLSWKSRDYYFGLIHRAALKETLGFFDLTLKDLVSGEFKEKIHRFRSSLLDKIKIAEQDPLGKKELGYYSGLYRGSAIHLSITKKTFSTIPSILDLLVNFGASPIVHQWSSAMDSAGIEGSGKILLFKKDICYHRDTKEELNVPEIPRIYHSLEAIDEL